MSGAGTTLSERVSMGSIGYGAAAAPPSDVLSSFSNQNIALPSIVAASAYVHGQVTIAYTQGSLPANISFSSTYSAFQGVVPGVYAPSSPIIVFHDGSWDDGAQQGNVIRLTLQPGQVVPLDFWIAMPEAINNAKLKFTQQELDLFAFTFYPVADQMPGNSVVGISGPQAAKCDFYVRGLLPFAHLPFSVSQVDYNNTVGATCKQGSTRPS
jgi:hypothetical protein